MILDYDFWKHHFGSNPDMVGQTMMLNGTPHEIAGVVRNAMAFLSGNILPDNIDVLVPMTINISNPSNRAEHGLLAVARIKSEISFEQAQQEINQLAQGIKEEYPRNYPDEHWGAYLQPLHDLYVGDSRPALLLLLGAVGLVLLIACANVANLLMARSVERVKEMSIRFALGSNPIRIIRQRLTEGLLLSSLGSAVGLLIAFCSTGFLVKLAEYQIPHQIPICIDLRVLGFTLGLSMLTGLIFGIGPAIQSSITNVLHFLNQGQQYFTLMSCPRLRKLLIISEVTITFILLVGAGLFLRSFTKLLHVDPGYQARNVATFRLNLPDTRYQGEQSMTAFYNQLLTRIRNIPGVEAVGAISGLPLSGMASSGSVLVKDLPPKCPKDPSGFFETDKQSITPGYFRSMGIQLLQGRLINETDCPESVPVAVIDETFAKRAWPDGQNPIGRQIATTYKDDKPYWQTVVGVVRHIKHQGLRIEGREQVYVPYAQLPERSMFITLKTSGDPTAVLKSVYNEVTQLDPLLPIYNRLTMKQRLSVSMELERLQTILVGAFGLLVLVLASTGLYGFISYSVSQRIHEIGVRMALGAQCGDVLLQVMRQGLKLAILGVALGLVGAFTLTRVLVHLLFGVTPRDPITFSGVALLLLTVAMLACYVPARRATLVDPMEALRYE
jgi:putative ABC transport system permease protein